MKWDQVKGRVYMQGFLMQLCLQCMVEAVETGANTFEWLYSILRHFRLCSVISIRVHGGYL